MQSADPATVSPRPRFPALDPEPPPRRWRRAGVMLLVVLAGLGTWLGFTASGPTAQHAGASSSVPRVRGLSGVVLSEMPGSFLSATDIATGKAVVFKSLGQFSSSPNPAVSADNRYLLDAAVGRLLALSRPGHLETVPNALSFSAGNMPGFMANPWSGNDADVVELTYPVNPQGFQAGIPVATVESVRTGRAVSLGQADSAAGDPRQAGAFIAVPAPGRPLSNGIQPDARLILADAGAHSRLIATTDQLNHTLGNEPGTVVSLIPVPNPLGSMVAVEVVSPTGGTSGLVVLSRNGAVLGSDSGIGFTGAIGWSHSGAVLAFASLGYAGAEFTEWKIGVQSVSTALHDASTRIGPTACAWSPDDVSVLCDGGPRGNWLVIRSNTESVTAGQGQPLAWTPGRLGG
ncbi:MAG TPA: hypothetical protein VLM11_15035 [Streptosporangiaceae bacterium]|nr:hypothetical protein [Streptosporangiaceae bacterium]